MAESAVKTAENIIRRASKAKSDVYLTLLDHRNTPTQGMWASPAQIMLSRRMKTFLPTSASVLNPKVTYNHGLKLKNKERQTQYYNAGAKDLEPLNEGDVTRMRPFKEGEKSWKKDTITHRLDDRLYEVGDGNKTYRRNCVDLARQAHVNQNQPRLQDTYQTKQSRTGLLSTLPTDKDPGKPTTMETVPIDPVPSPLAETVNPPLPKTTPTKFKLKAVENPKPLSPVRTRSGRLSVLPLRYR